MYNFLKIVEEILRFFEKFYEIQAKISGKFRKVWKYAFAWGSGAEASEVSEIIKNLIKKSMEACKLVKIFMNYERIFT